MDLSPPAESRREKAIPPGGSAVGSQGDRVEGAEPVDGSIPPAGRKGKTDDGGLYRNCPRIGRLHVGRCKGGASNQIITRRSELAPRAWAEAGQRQGNIRQTLCGRYCPTPAVR